MIYRHQLTFRLASLSVLGIALSGCGLFEEARSYTNIDGGRSTIWQEKVYRGYGLWGFLAGSKNYVRQTDLAQVISDASQSTTACSGDAGKCLSEAEKQFEIQYVGTQAKDKENGWIVRNIVQERLIMASNSACREFTQHLNTFQATSNFLLGAATVGTGAAAAIVTAAAAARALGGTTGALAGTRAELNADIFENKFVPVITRSIDDRRRTFLSALRGYEFASGLRPLPETEVKEGATTTNAIATAAKATASPDNSGASLNSAQVVGDLQAWQQLPDWQKYCRETSASVIAGQNEMNAEFQLPPNGYQCLPLQRYSLEAAIADAIYYNDLCSLDKGLENIQVALDIAKHPGLDALAAVQQAQNKYLQAQLEGLTTQQQIFAKQKEMANADKKPPAEKAPEHKPPAKKPPTNKPAAAP